jgi:hypothetical protein
LTSNRNTPRADTGKSPHEMMFSRPARTKIPNREKTELISEKRLRKEQFRRSYNKIAHKLPDIKQDQNIYFQHNNKWNQGKVTNKYSDRNYQVISED